VRDRVLVGVHRPRRVSGSQQIARRPLRLVGFGEVVREQPIHLRGRVAMELPKCLAHTKMQLLPAGLHQRLVRRLLHEPVPEAVLGCRSAPFLDHELEPLELRELRQQLFARKEQFQ
jgi:hypothetical protein